VIVGCVFVCVLACFAVFLSLRRLFSMMRGVDAAVLSHTSMMILQGFHDGVCARKAFHDGRAEGWLAGSILPAVSHSVCD
jgi:hypothetical protein